MIFVSTTYYKKKKPPLNKVLKELLSLNIDGIEIGSTHAYDTRKNLKKIIKKIKTKKIFIHNFFPPSRNENFLINIASSNIKIRNQSISLIKKNIKFCNEVGSLLYTIHPGFLTEAVPQSNFKKKNYDFIFSNHKLLAKDKGFRNMTLSLSKILSYAKKMNIKIAIETEGSINKKKFLMMQTPEEYKRLFKIFPNNLFVNFNIAHSYFASVSNKFSLKKFINLIYPKVVAVEISSNNKKDDQHLPLTIKSSNLKYLKFIKNKPIILEFRNASIESVKKSINLIKNAIK
jgi:sugar phosphate isomerase/epimerase|tara:strand:+ start:170 stop:1033 length:864 start_codon:yes stop_codon:yes gene_type:complete